MSDIVEQYTIRPIPGSARHGSARGLFPFWFTVNASLTTVGLGAFVTEFGFGLIPAIAAIVAGGAAGGLLLAWHSVQGPRLGLAQLIQSRAQFGFYGARLPNAAIWLSFAGYLVWATLTAGAGLAALWHVSYAQAVALVCFVTWLVVFFGYRIVHGVSRVLAVAALVLFAVLLVRLVQRAGGVPVRLASFGVADWFGYISLFGAAVAGRAPYVSDYSRYLPSGVSRRQVFWHTYLGSVSGLVIFATLGAVAGAVGLQRLQAVPLSSYLSGLLPSATWLATTVLLLGTVFGMAVNLYSSLLTGLAIGSRNGGAASGPVVRGIGAAVIMALGGFLAATAAATYLLDAANLAASLLYVVIPWSAINLADYYLVRRGSYDVGAIFRPAGPHGGVNGRALLALLAGVAAEVPFMNSVYPAYEGPVAAAWNGTDISWLVGFVVAGALYCLVAPTGRWAGRGRSANVPTDSRGRPGRQHD
jgi:NCS1 family nucleobase:cation symporter-1